MSENKIVISLSCYLVISLILCAYCVIAFAQGEFIYDSRGKRNPFIPLVTQEGRLVNLDKEESAGALRIEGIIYDKHGRSFAVVNGSVVGIGDAAGEYTVLKIEEGRVIFIKDGEAIEVELKKEGE